jgi:hypothetical protein
MAYKDYRFRDVDFRNMRFNVMEVPTGKDLLSHFKEMQQYPEFKAEYRGVSNSQVLRYIALMYDPQTPLRRIQDYEERKTVSAEASAFKTNNKGEFTEDCQEVMSMRNGKASLAMMRFLSLFHSMELTMMQRLFLTIHEKLFYEDVKAAVAAMTEYRKMEAIVLNDDIGASSRQAMYKIMMSKEDIIKRLRPEFFAREFKRVKDGQV